MKKPGLFSRFNFRVINIILNFRMNRSGLKFRTANLDPFSICYWDSENTKPVLLLMQAFTAESKYTWRKQVWKLSRQYRLIIPNLIYFGGSTSHSPKYSVAEQVEALEKLLTHLNVKSFSVCGASYSGIIVSEFASRNPGMIRKMAIIAMPVKYLTEEDRSSIYKRYGVSNRIELLVPENHQMIRNLIAIAQKHPPFMPDFIYKSLGDQLYEHQKENRKKLLAAFEKEQAAYDAKNYSFDFPVMLIWGKEDQLVPLHVGLKLKEHLGEKTRLEIFDDCAHLPNLEKPAEFNRLLLDFLKD